MNTETILPGEDRAMNNECRFSIHSLYNKARERYDDSEESLNDIAQIWGKLEKKRKVAQQSEMRGKIEKNCIAFHIIFSFVVEMKRKIKEENFLWNETCLARFCMLCYLWWQQYNDVMRRLLNEFFFAIYLLRLDIFGKLLRNI